MLVSLPDVSVDPDRRLLIDVSLGVEPGTSPEVPILPPVQARPGVFVFGNPPPRRWFDPPFGDGFDYELTYGPGTPSADGFTKVEVGPGFFDIDVFVDGILVESDLDFGETFGFGPGVRKFRLAGITPPVDLADSTAFPTFLDFSGSPSELRMTGIPLANGVPEPGSLALAGLALAGLALSRRRRFF